MLFVNIYQIITMKCYLTLSGANRPSCCKFYRDHGSEDICMVSTVFGMSLFKVWNPSWHFICIICINVFEIPSLPLANQNMTSTTQPTLTGQRNTISHAGNNSERTWKLRDSIYIAKGMWRPASDFCQVCNVEFGL